MKSLKWILNESKDAKVVCEILEKFRERTQHKLGKGLDPNKHLRNLPPDHVFGAMQRPDEYGAGDLMHNRVEGKYLRGCDHQRSLVHAVRQHLKKCNYHNFDKLKQAFKFYDRNGDDVIDVDELREVCQQLNLPVDDVILQLVMSYCANDDVTIDYVKFANFLNWKDKMPDEDDKEAPTLVKQVDESVTRHMRSSSVVGAMNAMNTKNFRIYGIPTIRTDLAAPTLKRVSDNKNYGDESSCLGLVSPSLYSSYGLTEKDFFLPRTQDEIKQIFKGVAMSEEGFQEAWRRALGNDPRGNHQVSVKTFRGALDDNQSAFIRSF